jgi:hypothetical protein
VSVQIFLLGIRRRRPNRILETPHIWGGWRLPIRCEVLPLREGERQASSGDDRHSGPAGSNGRGCAPSPRGPVLPPVTPQGPSGMMFAAVSGLGSGGGADRKRGWAVTGMFSDGSIGEFRVQGGGSKGVGFHSVSGSLVPKPEPVASVPFSSITTSTSGLPNRHYEEAEFQVSCLTRAISVVDTSSPLPSSNSVSPI